VKWSVTGQLAALQSSWESQAEGKKNHLQSNGKFNIGAVRIPVLTAISVSY